MRESLGKAEPTRPGCHGRAPGPGLRLLAYAVLAVAACGPPRPANPFSGPPAREGGDPATRRRVRLEVSCESCLITWRVGFQQDSERSKGHWSRALTVYVEPEGAMASLSATPASDARRGVAWIRVHADGDVIAEERGDPDAVVTRSGQTLTVEVLIPPEGEPG